MVPRNCVFNLSNTFMRRLFSQTKILNFKTEARMVSKNCTNTIDKLELFNSLFDSSVKEFIDIQHKNTLYKFLKPVNDLKNTYTFVIDEAVAKDIVRKIFFNSKTDESVAIEGNPGLGLITFNLIKFGISYVHVLENTSLQYLSLLQIILKHRRRITRKNLIMDKHSSTVISYCKAIAENQKYPVKFIGVCTSFYFLRCLILNFRVTYLWVNKFEVFLVITPAICQSIESFTPKYLKFLPYCILNVFFNIEKLASYPRSAFLPPSLDDNDNMILIKISLNSEFFKNFKSSELEEYFAFLTILGRRKNNFVIETLEKWLPDCGPYLISNGISVLNQIKDLSPQDSFTLFKLFQKQEGYDDFRNCILHVLKE